jgi:hypothetical protein
MRLRAGPRRRNLWHGVALCGGGLDLLVSLQRLVCRIGLPGLTKAACQQMVEAAFHIDRRSGFQAREREPNLPNLHVGARERRFRSQILPSGGESLL